MKKNKEKTFLIINNYFLGDILLVNPLVQNIKKLYPQSKVIMLVQPPFVDVAKYQYGVDDVIVWDRRGKDKGIIGTIKFLMRFPYKPVYAAFPIYGSDRSVFLSWLFGAKYILFYPQPGKFRNFLIKKKLKFSAKPNRVQADHINLLSGFTKEKLTNFEMKCDFPEQEFPYSNLIKENKQTIALCCTTSHPAKDIPFDVTCEIIEKLKDYKIVLMGKGETASVLSDQLKNKNYENLIDLSNKTSIIEAMNYIRASKAMISADTGLMHVACAVKTPVVCVFRTKIKYYMPDPEIYKSIVIDENQTAENIVENFYNLMNMSIR